MYFFPQQQICTSRICELKFVVKQRTRGRVLRAKVLLVGNTRQLEFFFQLLPGFFVVNWEVSDEMASLTAE